MSTPHDTSDMNFHLYEIHNMTKKYMQHLRTYIAAKKFIWDCQKIYSETKDPHIFDHMLQSHQILNNILAYVSNGL